MRYEMKESKFTWSGLGDIGEGRKNLGPYLPVLVYRLFQYTLRDVLAREYDDSTARDLYKAAGHLAGVEFTKNVLETSSDFDFFLANLANTLRDLKIGVLFVEKVDLEALSFILTVSEDADCSGLPVTGETVCDYDEGFISGIFETYFRRPFAVKEIDCWATGDRTCRFTVDGI